MAPKLTRQQRVALRTWTPQNLHGLWNAYLQKNPGAQLPATGFAPNVGGGFSPFQSPDRPPPGTYDPAIDAQVRASQRGYGDLAEDTDIGNARSQDDYTLASGELQRQLDRQLSDLGLGRERGHADYLTGKTNELADYNTDTGLRVRRYDLLGGGQTQKAAAMGVTAGGGGALQQALAKRLANRGIEQGAADVTHTRFVTAADLGEQRSQQDYETLAGVGGQGGRLREDRDFALGQLGLGLSRGNEDRANALARGGRENTQLGLDASEQRFYQAGQSGLYDPPTRPASEHAFSGQGIHAKAYRYVRTPRGTRRLLSTGYLVGK